MVGNTIIFLDKSRSLEFRIRPFAWALLLSKEIMQNKLFTKAKSLKPIHYLVIFLGVVLYVGAMVGIVSYRASQKINPPMLEVLYPVEGDIYSTEDVLVQGKSDKDVTISVGETKSISDNEGNFSFVTPIVVGKNALKIIATKNDLSTEKVVNVTREATVTKPTVPSKSDSVVKNTKTAEKLNTSGPESFWLVEAGSLSAVAVAFSMSRQKLQRARRKN